jgi:hypothetical protein
MRRADVNITSLMVQKTGQVVSTIMIAQVSATSEDPEAPDDQYAEGKELQSGRARSPD